MKVSQKQALEVLRDSVIHGLEQRNKGSRFPVLHAYLEMEGEDIDYETVKKLRDEFVHIQGAFGSLELGLYQDSQFVLVNAIEGRAYASNPDAPLVLRCVGVPRDYPAKEKLAELVNDSVAMCDEALRRECGFGKYSKPC